MPTNLRHRHRVGHSPCSTRLLTLGPPLIAALPLGACGPAHNGQMTVEPTGASPKTTPSGSPAPSATPFPDAVGNTVRDGLDGPERHDLQRQDRHVAAAGRHTQTAGRDINRNQPGLQLRHRRISSRHFLERRSIDLQRKKKGWRQHDLLRQGTADDVEPHFFRGDLRADSHRSHTGRQRNAPRI